MTDHNLKEAAFAPGNRITVEYVDLDSVVKTCATTVEDLEENYLVLKTPLIEGQPAAFKESQELTLSKLDDKTKAVYVTNVFVIDIRQGKVPLIVCSKPLKIERTSLRRYSRFGVDLPVLYSGSKTGGEGYICDLSLSGCYCVLKPNPKMIAEESLYLSFSIPGVSDVTVSAKIVRVDKMQDQEDHGVAFEFVDPGGSLQELLYGYIFQLQLTEGSILGCPNKGEQK